MKPAITLAWRKRIQASFQAFTMKHYQKDLSAICLALMFPLYICRIKQGWLQKVVSELQVAFAVIPVQPDKLSF